MKLTYKDRQVRLEVDHSSAACDAFFSAGYYTDNGDDLTDSELDELTETRQDKLSEYCLEQDGFWRE